MTAFDRLTFRLSPLIAAANGKLSVAVGLDWARANIERARICS